MVKKLYCIVLCFILVMGMMIPAFAATSTPVTVNITEEEGAEAIISALYRAGEQASETQPYEIHVGAGRYELDRGLHIFSNTALVLDSNAVIVDCAAQGDNMVKVGTTGDDPASGYYYKNISVLGGKWDGNGKVATMFKFVHAKNCVLKDVTAYNLKDAHFIEMAGVDGMQVLSCDFSEHIFTTNKGTEAIQIDVLQKDHIAGYVHLDDEIDYLCKNIVIDGCCFNGMRRAIGAHTAVHGKYYEHISITNNAFIDTTEKSILCTNMEYLTITGNTISGDGVGIEIKNTDKTGAGYFLSKTTRAYDNTPNIQSTRAVIENNEIVSRNNHAILLNGLILNEAVQANSGEDPVPAGQYPVENVTIQNNTLTAFDKYSAVKIQYGRNIRVLNNTITKNTTAKTAVYVCDGTAYSEVSGNRFLSKTVNGVKVAVLTEGYPRNYHSQINRNRFEGNTDFAVRINDHEKGSINANTILQANIAGIQIDKNPNTNFYSIVENVCDNVIKNAKVGIRVSTGLAQYVRRNKIYPTIGNAMQIDNRARVYFFEENTIASAGDNAISVKNSIVNYIRSNVIAKPKNNGIFCYENGSISLVSANKITGCVKDGIRIGNSIVYNLNENTITAKEYGVYVYGGKNQGITKEMRGNKICYCQYPVYISKGPTVRLYSNSFAKNTKANRYYVAGTKKYQLTNLKKVNVKVTTGKNAVKLYWGKQSSYSGYIISYSNAFKGIYSKLAGCNKKAVGYTRTYKADNMKYFYRITPYLLVPGSNVYLYADYTQTKGIALQTPITSNGYAIY